MESESSSRRLGNFRLLAVTWSLLGDSNYSLFTSMLNYECELLTQLCFGPRTSTCLKHAEVLLFITWLLLIEMVQLRWCNWGGSIEGVQLRRFNWGGSIEEVRLRRFDWGGSIEADQLRRIDWGGSIEEVQLRRFDWGGSEVIYRGTFQLLLDIE